MNVDDRAPVAAHEAGHVVVAFLLKGRIDGPVSILPARHWSGMACVGGRRAPQRDVDRSAFGGPVVNLRASVRREAEVEAMILLAGHEAEQYAGDVRVPASTERDDGNEALALPAFPSLSKRDAKLLARGNAPGGEIRNDVTQIFDAVELVTSEGVRAHALIEFLSVETAALLATGYAQKLLRRLATALLEHESLSARAVRQLLAATA